jgi:hypothetical protein
VTLLGFESAKMMVKKTQNSLLLGQIGESGPKTWNKNTFLMEWEQLKVTAIRKRNKNHKKCCDNSTGKKHQGFPCKWTHFA